MSKMITQEDLAGFKADQKKEVADHFYKTTLQKYQSFLIFISLNILLFAVFTLIIREVVKP